LAERLLGPDHKASDRDAQIAAGGHSSGFAVLGQRARKLSQPGDSARRSIRFRRSMWYGSSEVTCTEIKLLSGDIFTVEGNTDEVERALSDAARSGQSRLAWLTECGKGHAIGINPTHVIAVKLSEISD
jgi:hypothetical protein